MNISFENPDKINGLMTLTFEKEDYQTEVDKTLKDYRKRPTYRDSARVRFRWD